MKDEVLKRFLEKEAKGINQDPYQPFLLSRDRTIGLLKEPDHSLFLSLGKFKLKRRPYGRTLRVFDMYLDINHLFRAMYVFRRRKKFELGFYPLYGGDVFGIREGEDIILLAPTIGSYPLSALKLEDLVTRVNKSYLEKLKTWSRILHGKKYGDGNE